jgi:hypothetical protein
MVLMMTRVACEADIAGILGLQSRNLYTNLSETERAAGFVTTPFTVEQIQGLLDQVGGFVAEKQGMVWVMLLREAGSFSPNGLFFPT